MRYKSSHLEHGFLVDEPTSTPPAFGVLGRVDDVFFTLSVIVEVLVAQSAVRVGKGVRKEACAGHGGGWCSRW